MEESVRQVIEQCARASHAGELSFAQLVGMLAAAGVQSYHADYRKGETTYYAAQDAACSVPLPGPAAPIADAFDPQALQLAIRGAQAGSVQYPQFVALSRAAGCVAYTVWIAGRHVAYFGRRGETHIEHFPS